MTYKASGPTGPGALFQNMNEIMKCVEMLKELLREQIKRNTDLHLMLSEQFADLNEARRERDAAWNELSALKARMKEESVNWRAEGYRYGMIAALLPSGSLGAKWYAEQNQLQGDDADEYIAGFNEALDEYEQEEAK